MSNANGSAGLRVGYEQTRVFGYMGEVTFFTGDVKFGASKCIIKAINADLMATVNFAPLFYKSTTRRSFFEPRFFAGFGVNHICGYPSGVGNNNDLISKLGLDLGFNVGRNRHVYVFLQPAINYNLDHYSRTQYNINYSALQIAAGIHYRFSLFQRKDKVKPQEKDPAEAVTIITTPAITPSTPVREETPVTVSVTPAKEEKPEVKPVTPAKEEKGKETAETTVAKDTPKAVHQKPVIHDVSSSSTKSKNSATAKKSAEAKTPATTQGTTASKASEATKTPDSSVPATAPKASTATKSPDSAVPATTQKSSTTAKAPAASKSTSTKKNAEASKTAATKKTSGVEKKQEETPKPKTTPQTKPAQSETGSQPTTSTPLSVRQKQGGLTEVATFLKTHPKTTVTIRGDKYQAEEARNQLVRRYNISLNRITIQPDSNAAKLTFEVEM